MIVEELKIKYNLAPQSYLKRNVWHVDNKELDFEQSATEHKRIQSKWAYKYGQNWYGIEMTNRMPVVFYKTIDEFLDWVLINNPDFEIHQIKQKFSQIRIYLGNINKETQKYCWELENLLTDNNIMW